jgi:hypothetical protein
MLGLHPEEVKSDWREVLSHIRQHLPPSTFHEYQSHLRGRPRFLLEP